MKIVFHARATEMVKQSHTLIRNNGWGSALWETWNSIGELVLQLCPGQEGIHLSQKFFTAGLFALGLVLYILKTE